MNKAYFKQSFKASYKTMLILTIIGIIIYPVILLFNDYSYPRNEWDFISCDVGYIITFLAILTYIIPFFKSSYVLKKKTVDVFYSLPIKRTELLNTNILVGILEIIIPYTIAYTLGFLVMLCKAQQFTMIYYLPLFFISILTCICIYLFNTFTIIKANTIYDAVIFLVMYTLIFCFIALFISRVLAVIYNIDKNSLLGGICNFFDSEYMSFTTFYPFIKTGNHFANLIGDKADKYSYFNVIYPFVLGIIGYVGSYFSIKNDEAERAEQISKSKFGYTLLIPIVYFCIGFSFTISNYMMVDYLSLVFLTIIAVIGYMIAYRTLKLPKKVYITMAILFATIVIFSIITNSIYIIN